MHGIDQPREVFLTVLLVSALELFIGQTAAQLEVARYHNIFGSVQSIHQLIEVANEISTVGEFTEAVNMILEPLSSDEVLVDMFEAAKDL